jgi:hypothetical protein
MRGVEDVHEILFFNSALTWLIAHEYFSVIMDTLHNYFVNLAFFACFVDPG